MERIWIEELPRLTAFEIEQAIPTEYRNRNEIVPPKCPAIEIQPSFLCWTVFETMLSLRKWPHLKVVLSLL